MCSLWLQLDSSTIWLKEEYGQRAFFPDSRNTHFQFPDDISPVVSLVVEGSAQSRQTQSSTPIATPMPSTSSSGTTYRPIFSSSRKGQSLNLKVIQANLTRVSNGKVEFTHTGQTFIDLSESTANVHYITSVVQTKWGHDYVLVTSDGLRIEDSSGTQGMYNLLYKTYCF